MSQSTICITILQVEADARMRGRVISIAAMAIFGMLPLGSVLVGAISQKIGAPDTVLYEGVTALIIAALFSKFLRSDRLHKKERMRVDEAEDLVMEKI